MRLLATARGCALVSALAVVVAGVPAAPGPDNGVRITLAAGQTLLESGDRLIAWHGVPWEAGARAIRGAAAHPFDILQLAPEVPGFRSLVLTVERRGERIEVAWDRETLPISARLETASDAPASEPLDLAWRQLEQARELHADEHHQAAERQWSAAVKAAAGFPAVQAAVLERWADATDAARRSEVAEDLFARAAEILRQHRPQGLALAAALHGQGSSALRTGIWSAAVEPLEAAVALRRRLAPGTNTLRLSLNNLGVAYKNVGRLRDAQEVLEEGLAIARRLDPGSLREASMLNNLGTLAYERGDLVIAEKRLRASKELRQKLAPDSLKLAQSLNNLGALMEERGELEKAEVWYRQALDLRRRLAASDRVVVSTLINLATLLERRGAARQAVDLARQAATLAAVATPASDSHAWALKVLAQVLIGSPAPAAEDSAAATRAARQAVEICRRLAPDSMATAGALAVLGEVHLERDEIAAAEAALREALDIRAGKGPGSRWEADSWHALAELEHRRGRLELAVDHQLRAIGLVEATAGPAGETAREQARAAAESVDWYRQTSLWLVALGRSEEAFDVAERARARGLLATLAERRLSFDRDLPAAVEASRQQLASRYETAWQRLIEAGSPATVAVARAELNDLRDERQVLERRIREVSPRLARLRRPTPTTADVARSSLRQGTLLLAWVVDRDAIVLLSLLAAAGGAELSAHRIALGSADLAKRIDAWRALLENPSPGTATALGQLSRGLWDDLLAPVAGQLAAARRLIVVPDRALHRLPFSALIDGEGRYLVQRLPVSRAPSVTIALRHPLQPVSVRRPLIAFGDPQPGQDPLAWSRFEVETLGERHPGPSRVLLGEAASESTFKRLGPETGFIHFAGHTEIEDLLAMDSFLRLAAGDGDNGLLHAWEIFERLRIDAELVTLSGCETSLGREVDGEGLAGLAQSFIFAGARAVVSSQWKVRDRPTALLMIRFYHHLTAGRELDEALRAAQLDLLQNRVAWPEAVRGSRLQRLLRWAGLAEVEAGDAGGPDLAHPNRWAGFELILGGG